jgi:hypothetical protein
VRNGYTIFDPKSVATGQAKEVHDYSELVQEIAELSYKYKDYILMFRGQEDDFSDSLGRSTLLPSIYRNDMNKTKLSKVELQHRYCVLSDAATKLINECNQQRKEGRFELEYKKPIQWSILQHYNVCSTPYLDVTQSLRVACSFALNQSTVNSNTQCNIGYVYVLALPYLTNRISVNSEHDIVTVRLLSISPPRACRPYHQEGYMTGTEFITTNYKERRSLDFNRRLVAKYKINSSNFWLSGENTIPMNVLMPEDDPFIPICNRIRSLIVNK